MYNANLTTSHFPAQTDVDIREATIGELLREIAHERPNAEALVEVRQDGESLPPDGHMAKLLVRN